MSARRVREREKLVREKREREKIGSLKPRPSPGTERRLGMDNQVQAVLTNKEESAKENASTITSTTEIKSTRTTSSTARMFYTISY